MLSGTYAHYSDDELAAIAAKLPIRIADPIAHFRGRAKVYVRRLPEPGALGFGHDDGGVWITCDDLAALEANGMRWPPAPAAAKPAPRPTPTKPAPRPAPKPKPLPLAAKARKTTPKDDKSMSRIERAIKQLGAIAADAKNPDSRRAARALERMAHPDRIEGATYLSPYAEELDRKMGLSGAGRGVRVEGNQLILSPTRKPSGVKRPASLAEIQRLIGGLR